MDGSSNVGAWVAIILVIAFLCGLISSAIARNKGLSAGTYFLVGFLLGLIGIVIAAVVAPANRLSAPGWYPDPWTPGGIRWHDGRQWTPYTQPGQSESG